MWLSPSLFRVSSFVSFCCAVTFSTVKPLPELGFSDSLLMTEPSSLGNLLQVTIATGKGGELSGSWARSQVMSSPSLTTSPSPLSPSLKLESKKTYHISIVFFHSLLKASLLSACFQNSQRNGSK